MMYQEKFVVALKSAEGKILREHGDTIYIPYSSEYSIYLKNMNSVRASVSITIDGKSVFPDGTTLVVNPNSDICVERFVERFDKGNKFKFIEKTDKISEHRGDKAEDGLIRISFKYEKEIPKVIPNITSNKWPIFGGITNTWESGIRGSDAIFANSVGANSLPAKSRLRSSSMQLNSVQHDYRSRISTQAADGGVQVTASRSALNTNEKGITVAGSVSEQKFNTISAFPLEVTEHVIVLRILGELGQNKIIKPVVVKRKVECPTCGTSNKGSSKFCVECGTALLELVPS